MKYIISERQYKILKEQKKEFDYSSGAGSYYGTYGYDEKGETTWTKLDQHTKNEILAFGTAFIPVVGPFISAAIGLTNAALYYKEGDEKSAGLTAAFSMLPFVGSVVSKIPGVRQLGSKGMAALASKIGKGVGNLTKTEMEIANLISQNSDILKKELSVVSSKLAPITKEIKSLKPQYIERFGQSKYDELLEKLLDNKIDKDEFIKFLSSNKKTGLVQGVKGIKMTAKEINKISEMAKKIVAGEKPNGILKIQVGNDVKEVTINFVKNNNNTVATAGFTNDFERMLTINLKNIPKNADEVKRIIYHEITHMKDPTPQFLKINQKTGKYYVTGSGSQFADEASQLMAKANEIKKSVPKGQELPKEYYNLKNRAEKLFQKYEYSPSEKIANLQMVYNSVPDKINSIIKNYSSKFGKKKANDTLNMILKYFKGQGGNIDWIFGKRQVDYINGLKTIDTKQYNEIVKKIFQEIQNVKLQIQ